MRRRRLTLVAALAETTDDPRVLRALLLPYGEPGRTSAGLLSARAGAVTWPADLRRVKILLGHDRERPIGYLRSVQETQEGLVAEMYLADTPEGSAALLEAREGARDGVSVELESIEISDDDVIQSAELVAVAMVPLPAFSSARLAAEDAGPDDEDDEQDNPQEDQVDPETEGVPEVQAARAPAGLVATRPRVPQTLNAAAEYVAQAFRGDRSAAAINAALADITPTSTNVAVTQPVAWLGEIWTPIYQELLWTGVVGHAPMTGMRMVGWRRVPPDPTIKPWAGEKTAIGTDANLRYEPYEINGTRHAVGVDFARELVDWGDSSVITTWLQLVIQSYADILDASVGALVLANVGTPLTAATVPAAFSKASNTLRRRGAKMTFAALAGDLYDQLMELPTSEAPWWLNQVGGATLDLAGEGGSVKGMSFFVSEDVPDGQLVAGDKRAVTLYEPAGNPIKVQTIDLPRGGIDHSVHGYSALGLNNAAGLVAVTVGAVTP